MAIQALKRRFDELLVQLDAIEAKRGKNGMGGEYVDDNLFLGWRVKARNLLSQACGANTEHYRQFEQTEKDNRSYQTNYDLARRLRQVFLAAREDYEGGYLKSIRSLVHAELFDDELDQARELQASGYKTAAAVVAGVVLETTLRTLCGDRGIPVGKLDKMNADLAKDGLYNKLVLKQITALADIRNKAAHGETAGFTDDDVIDMIKRVERFLSDYPTA
jgi:hypothetical protein